MKNIGSTEALKLSLAQTQARANLTTALLSEARRVITQREAKIQELQEALDSLHSSYENIVTSKSWRMTAPLRSALALLQEYRRRRSVRT
jgi:hypothetical protein